MKAEVIAGFAGTRLQRPALVWQNPGRDEAIFLVRPGQPVTIGRDPASTIHIDSTFVSKAHAVVQFTDGELTVEDLGSANGTMVNGSAVRVLNVRAGDVIELGEERLLIKDLAAGGKPVRPVVAAPVDPAKKNLRLAIVAGITLAGMTSLLMMAAPSSDKTVSTTAAPVREIAVPARPAGVPPVATTAPVQGLIAQAVERATVSGIPASEALFDEAQVHQEAGRLLEAQALYDAAGKQTPPHPLAAARYKQVSEQLDYQLAVARAEAEKAHSQMQHAKAVAAWERVLMLTDPADPRHAEAQTGLARSKEFIRN